MTCPVEASVRLGGKAGTERSGGSRSRPAAEALARGYRLVAELLLHPDERDREAVEAGFERVPGGIRDPVGRFLAEPAARSPGEYVHTLELSPPCPLYLGAYLFDEPGTCRGAALSERNRYMLDLTGVYRHFRLEPEGGELPDFLPVVVEFLALSLGGNARHGGSLRRLFLEEYVTPALSPLRKKLTEYGSPYAGLVEALERLVSLDLEGLEGVSPWAPEEPMPSPAGAVCRERLAVRLPVLPSPAPAGIAPGPPSRASSETPRPEE